MSDCIAGAKEYAIYCPNCGRLVDLRKHTCDFCVCGAFFHRSLKSPAGFVPPPTPEDCGCDKCTDLFSWAKSGEQSAHPVARKEVEKQEPVYLSDLPAFEQRAHYRRQFAWNAMVMPWEVRERVASTGETYERAYRSLMHRIRVEYRQFHDKDGSPYSKISNENEGAVFPIPQDL